MIESVKAAFSLPDLRKRILFTIAMLIIYRLAANIPVPGVDLNAWLLFSQQESGNRVLDFLNLLSGGAVQNFSVMAMGVYPYITASIIIQLLTPIIPQLEELQSEGETGRNKLNQITYYITVPLALLQAVSQIRLIGLSFGGGTGDSLSFIMPNFGFGATQILPTLTTLLAMLGGTMFAIWLGNLITEDGIGQGVSLIIFGGIVSGILPGVGNLWTLDTTARYFTLTAFILLTIITVFVIVVIQEGQRRIRVTYGRRVRGRKTYQGQSSYIPLKVNTAGMIPIIFAQSIAIFPPLIASLFVVDGSTSAVNSILLAISNFGGNADPRIDPWGFGLYWLFYFALVVGFTFFYTDVMIKQQNIPENLQRQGGFIPGKRPGRPTQNYITMVVRRITFAGAIFLGTVAILPGIMELTGVLLNLPGIEQSALVIRGSGLIIVVGVVIDTMRQLESQLVMRQYEGFF
ncbi:MAG: preprotein translocase subunit SecY [Anaerolineales bacterium]|nr:preprotein translocase subunit SecY [Anaerolineales bacterium]